MTYAEAARALDNIVYKKGFSIILENADSPFLGYTLLRIAEDGVETPRDSYIILDNMTENTFVHKVFNELLNWERHECGEFFKYKGVQIFNPHADVNVLVLNV